MPKVTDIFVTSVLVVDEQARNTSSRVSELAKILQAHYANYEVIIVDNGMATEGLAKVRKLLPKLACIRVLRLSRKYDTDTAIFAGVEASIGDYVCILYNNDPVKFIPKFVSKNLDRDIVFGTANNLLRQNFISRVGAKAFYWYSKRYLHIQIPRNATYFISMNRSVANALTRSGRFMRHIRHMAHQVGFSTTTFNYELDDTDRVYARVGIGALVARAIDLASSYSSHPLRLLSYCGVIGGLLNVIYATYVVILNLSSHDLARGWTTLSLQSSFMFFLLFLILAVLAEYIGKILNESQQEPPYHIMQELSSTISIADETRLNITK